MHFTPMQNDSNEHYHIHITDEEKYIITSVYWIIKKIVFTNHNIITLQFVKILITAHLSICNSVRFEHAQAHRHEAEVTKKQKYVK